MELFSGLLAGRLRSRNRLSTLGIKEGTGWEVLAAEDESLSPPKDHLTAELPAKYCRNSLDGPRRILIMHISSIYARRGEQVI